MRATRGIALLLAAGLLALAGARNRDLLEARRAYQPGGANPLDDASPLVAFTHVALGGLRGVAADILWVRLSRMQEEGKYFELNQLARWITALEPRIPEVWTFHAWNLAYNISVLFDTPEDRWRWVRAGLDLLRDDALRHNPHAPSLYWELGWMFQHKLGMDLDQMHQHYKVYWAAEMQYLFDGPGPDYAAFRALPPDEAALRRDPEAADLLGRLDALGFDALTPRARRDTRVPPGVLELMDTHPAAERLNRFALRRVLESRYGLRLDHMEEVDESFGPLDWRLPETHALYWAWRGRPFARDFERLRLDRMVFHNVATAFRRGRLQVVPGAEAPLYTPNLPMLDKALAAFALALRDHPGDRTILSAHRFFLIDAVQILFQYGQERRAGEIFAQLREAYPAEVRDRPFLDYVIAKYAGEDFGALAREEAVALIEGALSNALVQQALGESARAQGFARYAREVYDRYQRARCDTPAERERVCLQPFAEYQRLARTRVKEILGESAPETP
jgi:hypothetical protein